MIKTTFRIIFENIYFGMFTKLSAKIWGPHPYPPIGRPLLSYMVTPTLLEGTIVSLVRVGVALLESRGRPKEG